MKTGAARQAGFDNVAVQETQGAAVAVTRVTRPETLQALLDGGLNQLYQDVFGQPPYNEVFTRGEVDGFFSDYLKANGVILVALDPVSRAPVAFMVSVPLESKFNVAALLCDNVNVPKAAYIADDGVRDDYRGQGLSTALKQMVMDICRDDNFSEIVLRTSAVNYRQISAVFKAGGERLEGVAQTVTRTVRGGETVDEPNIFFTFNLEGGKMSGLVPVCRSVIAPDAQGRHIGYVDRNVDAGLVRQNYPGVAAVIYAPQLPDVETPLFNGRMYLPVATCEARVA